VTRFHNDITRNLILLRAMAWYTNRNKVAYEEVKLETWSLNQRLPERTTFKLTIILPALILCIFRIETGNDIV
jgi:hypothetical protein